MTPRAAARILLWLALSSLVGGPASAAASAIPSYPPSPVFIGIRFDETTKRTLAPGSDNWAITWADDDHQYATWGDGGGFGGTDEKARVSLGFARIEGAKGSYTGHNVWGGKSAEHPAQFPGKSYGIISIGGVIYAWRGYDTTGGGPGYGTQTLYRSSDHCASFTATEVSYDEGFFCPTILNFGRDYAGARDEYVYMYAPERKRSEWEVSFPGEIMLFRAPITGITRASAYEFFTGLDDAGRPTWTYDVAKRKPVFTDPANGVMRTSVSYNAPLGRYFLVTQQADRVRDDYHIGIYDAPEPWGPWTTMLFANAADCGLITRGYKKTVFFNFANKWLSPHGKRFVLVYTDEDNWATMEGSFVTAGTPGKGR